MNRLIFPEILRGYVTAFFTGKYPGADRNLISSALSKSNVDVYMPIQKHTDKIIVLDSSREPKIADAVITVEKNVLIGVQVADCVPIIIYDKEKGIMAAVHAGWRGTASGILKITLDTMVNRFFVKPADILIAFGPSIRWCCYQVDYTVLSAVQCTTGEGDYYMDRGDKHCLDLSAANRYQADSMGIPSSNMWISDECTFCYPDKYFSYRYAKGPTGRQGGFIGLI